MRFLTPTLSGFECLNDFTSNSKIVSKKVLKLKGTQKALPTV